MKMKKYLFLVTLFFAFKSQAFEVDGFIQPFYVYQLAMNKDEDENKGLMGVEFGRVSKNFSADIRFGSIEGGKLIGPGLRIFNQFDFNDSIALQPGVALTALFINLDGDLPNLWQPVINPYLRGLFYLGANIGLSLEMGWALIPDTYVTEGNPSEGDYPLLNRIVLGAGIFIDI